MAKKKGVRIIVTLECTEARGLGETPSRYCTQKVIGCPTPQLLDQLMDWVGTAAVAAATAASGLGHASCAVGTHTLLVVDPFIVSSMFATHSGPDITGS
jgi:hypothetical protein